MVRDVRLKVITDVDDKGLDKAARKFDDLGDEAQQAARKIAELKLAQKALGAEFVKTGSIDVLRNFRQAGRDIRTFENIGKALGTELKKGTEDAAVELPGRFGRAIGEMPPQVQLAIGAGVAAAIPAIGAAINAGVLLGVGGGALGAGLLIAIKDPRVQQAGAQLGQELMGSLSTAAAPITAEVLKSIQIIRSGFDSVSPAISRIFATIAPEVSRLAQGVVGFVQQALPGIQSAVAAARPLFDALAAEMPAIGRAVSIFFQEIAGGGSGALLFFQDLLHGIEITIVSLGALIEALAKVYYWMSATAHLAGGDLSGAMAAAAAASSGASASLNLAGGALKGMGFYATNAKDAINGVRAAILGFGDSAIAAEEAALAWRNGMASLVAGIKENIKANKENGRSLDISTAAGRINRQLILGQIQAAKQSYEANMRNADGTIKSGHAADVASAKYRNQIQVLKNQLYALGLNKAQVNAYIDSLAGIPKSKTTTIKAIDKASATIASVRRALGGLYDKTITISENIRTNTTGIGGSTFKGRRFGGIDYAAADGMIATRGPLIKFAEPETGGEAYIPRRGISESRAASLIGTVAGWHPQAAAAAGVGGCNCGGDITVHVELDGYQVGRALGRRADLYARGG